MIRNVRSKVRRERELASNPGHSQQLLRSNHNNNDASASSHCNDEPPGHEFPVVSSVSPSATDLYSATLDQLSSSSSVENWLNGEYNFSVQKFKERELISSKTLTYVDAKSIRDHCFITNFRDITEALEFDPLPDHFFLFSSTIHKTELSDADDGWNWKILQIESEADI